MRIGFAGGIIAVLVLLLIIVGYGSLFTVYQTKLALARPGRRALTRRAQRNRTRRLQILENNFNCAA